MPPDTPSHATDRLDDDDYPAYTMGRAAEMIGATPGFLRAIGEARLITPLRSEGGHRRYSRYQLRIAARARELVDSRHARRGRLPDRHPGGPAGGGAAPQRGAARPVRPLRRSRRALTAAASRGAGGSARSGKISAFGSTEFRAMCDEAFMSRDLFRRGR